MARYERFTFLCNQDERLLIENLAQCLQRTQSDAIRLLIREAAQQLSADSDAADNRPAEVQRATD